MSCVQNSDSVSRKTILENECVLESKSVSDLDKDLMNLPHLLHGAPKMSVLKLHLCKALVLMLRTSCGKALNSSLEAHLFSII